MAGTIARKITRSVFWFEIALNVVALYLMSKPLEFFATFIPPEGRSQPQQLERAAELFGVGGQAFLGWYMVLLTVLTAAEARALYSGNDAALACILEGFVLGDVLHAYASYTLATAVGGWTSANYTGFVLSWLLVPVRACWLLAVNPGSAPAKRKGSKRAD